VEWSKIRLNIGSAAEMKKALSALADTKKVYALEARMLGLAPMLNENGELPGEEELVEVPAWRYAMVNYPHPLLSNGLSILDTPGLNALGMEPELTVSTVPNAHAILFLLSIDTGVTKSDLEIWDRYVRPGLPQKIAVLNKIDLMWDELKTQAEIDKAIARMVDTTAAHLHLPRERIFAISAQKGLLGKIRDDAGLVKKSGLEDLENFLAQQIVPMKRQILCKAVVNEIGGMMASSRASVRKKEDANLAEIGELNGLVGKSRDVVTKLWGKITTEKNAYNSALAEYKVNHGAFTGKRAALMDLLNPQKLDSILAESAASMEGAWTTVGLQRGMRELTRLMSEDFEAVFAGSEDIKKMMQGVYNTFIEKFAFQRMTLPTLDLDPHRTKLKLLVHETEAFAKDPVNVAHYKGPLVKKFYSTLVKQARSTFMDAKSQTERWVQAVTLPLEVQIKDHKAQLQSRLDNLAKINEKTTTINEQMALLKAAETDLRKQRDMIESLIMRVSQHEVTASLQAEIPPAARPDQNVPIELMQTMKMSTFEATRPAPTAARPAPKPPAPPVAPAAPMVSDDMFASLAPRPADAVFDPMKTQILPGGSERTQRIDVAATQKMDVATTQKLDIGSTQPMEAAKPPRSAEGERTQKIPALDAGFKPEATQMLDGSPKPFNAEDTQILDDKPANPTEAERNTDAQVTKRLDDSIWRLQEARRILQGLPQKQ
jgi:hypothetical protein